MITWTSNDFPDSVWRAACTGWRGQTEKGCYLYTENAGSVILKFINADADMLTPDDFEDLGLFNTVAEARFAAEAHHSRINQ